MIINMTGGGGGAGLNLKVVGGLSRPSSPAENTIRVNTDTAINGYAFLATAPENPVEGMVWFGIGIASTAPINIDKKNTVMLYPVICQQYVSGAWVSKEAETYIDGVWLEWAEYLYNYGVDATDITGGWSADGWTASASIVAGVLSSDRMVFNGITDKHTLLATNNKLDLSAYSAIEVKINVRSIYNGASNFNFCLWSQKGNLSNNKLAQVTAPATIGEQTLIADLSNIQGAYVGFNSGGHTSYQADVLSIELKR